MATFSRREPDGFLTSATHSRRCTGQGIEVDSTTSRSRSIQSPTLRARSSLNHKSKQWLGHPQNLMDLYAAQLRHDMTYRREWCSAGLGFELGELGNKSRAPIRPSLVA
jgi:hypothetical protein